MTQMYVKLMSRFHRNEAGQDGFEYLLISGAVVTAVAIAIVAGVNNDAIGDIVDAVVTAVTDVITG